MADRQHPRNAPRTTDQVANRGDDDALTRLWRASARLQRLTVCVRAVLPPDLAPQVQVTTLQGKQLTLAVPNAGWGTRLRLAAGDVLQQLAALEDFRGVTRIQVKLVEGSVGPPAVQPPLNAGTT
jgi:hypothetical protein